MSPGDEDRAGLPEPGRRARPRPGAAPPPSSSSSWSFASSSSRAPAALRSGRHAAEGYSPLAAALTLCARCILQSITSVGITEGGDLDMDKMNGWLGTLLREKVASARARVCVFVLDVQMLCAAHVLHAACVTLDR